MNSFLDWFRWLNDSYGINFVYFYDAFERARLLGGMETTLELSAICIGLSILIGVFGAWMQGARLAIVRIPVQAYIQFFRNTPPLIQLYFFYFAIGPQLPLIITSPNGFPQPLMGGFAWAVVSLAFCTGAFNVEIFRSGIEAVPRSMIEAAESLGYTRLQIYRFVIMPLALRVCLPALNNNMVNLIKTTTQAYAIAVPEVLFVANQIWSDHINVGEMMITLFAFFLLVIGVVVWVMHLVERWLRIPGFGQ
jgi:polar amino acid transport system permease protein